MNKIVEDQKCSVTVRAVRLFLRFLLFSAIGMIHPASYGQEYYPLHSVPAKYIPDTRIDNMGYWQRMAELGLVTVQPLHPTPFIINRNSKLSMPGIATYDSPDVPVTETNSLQSENSIFADPVNGNILINSNNSHPAPYIGSQYGADALQSLNGGSTWDGTIQGAAGYNFGDPTTAINLSGRMFVGYIFSGGGQGVSYSDDKGQTWHKRGVASAPGGIGSILDKNHLWIDNSLSSPYKGYLYDGWTSIGGVTGSGFLEISRSMDAGLAWQNPVTISSGVNAGSHNQGINIHTGPAGEVYAVWSIYDVWPGNEKALGFARSLNGGQTWEPAKRILNNTKGIRLQGVNKLMRVNSFPSMAVDISNGPDKGSIYVVWTNVGVPGVNTGVDIDIYFIKSTDKGNTWSVPVKINQDASGKGKQHFFPWITCDPDNGNLAVVFYDDRNVPDDMAETWVAISKNGGMSWQDFRVSDVAFTPLPLTGLSDNYFGDYLGITSKGGMVYPCWTDNRTGEAMGYVSPFRIGAPAGQPFIDYYTHFIDDTLSGNGNAKAEYGESFAISLSMRNIGDQADSLVNVTLSCESPFVQILNATRFFGDFESGQIKSIPQSFQIRLSDSIPDNLELIFTLTATDFHDSIFMSSFPIRSNAPRLSVGPLYVTDTAGNGNNLADPGESVILCSVLTNTGNYSVPSAVSRLFTTQSYCTIINPVVNSGQLAPGDSDTIYWHVDIDSLVPVGSSAGFIDSLSYSGQQIQSLFFRKIGVLTEDWESGNLSKMAWKTAGSKPWNINNFMVYEGTYSLRSGYIKSEDTSILSISLNLAADDSISFYRKVSSELNYDFLGFYIDDLKVGQWSGEKDWARVSFPVTAGNHTLKWKYIKDEGLSVGYDAAWIDFIEFPVQQRTMADAGPDTRICGGSTFQPQATATNYQSLKWSTTGSGFFDDPSIFNPVYYPSPADNEAGTVQLIITLKGYSYGEIVKDTLTLTIAPKPALSAGPDLYICSGEVVIPETSASNYNSVRWYTTGDGFFANPDTLKVHYYPGPTEIHNHKASLVVKITPEAVCRELTDTLLVSIYPGFSATFKGDTSICLGDTAYLNLGLIGQGPWRIYRSDGLTISTAKPLISIPVSPLETTVYRIDSISNLAGCTYRNSMVVKVNVLQPPDVSMLGPVESCSGRLIVIQADADSAAGFFWTAGEEKTSFISTSISGYPGENKNYVVKVTGTNGCSTSDSLLVKIVSECKDKKAGNVDIRYFPNPSDGHFSIVLSSATSETAGIRIFSGDGKLVFDLPNVQVSGVRSIRINLGAYAQGTYLLKVKSRSGELNDKLVIKK